MLRDRIKMNLLLSVGLLGLNLLLFNVLQSRARIFRIDLTEGNVYTLSEGTQQLLDGLEEPVELLFYYTSPEEQNALLRPLIPPMKDLLAEFSAAGGDLVTSRFVELDKAGREEREQAAEDYGVRPVSIPVRTAFQSGVKATYFNLVVAAGTGHETFDLRENFEELLRISGTTAEDFRVELGDIEYLVAKTIFRLTRGFSSIPGALAARDLEARVRFFVSEKPESVEDLPNLRKAVEEVGSELARKSGGRFTYTVEDPLRDLKQGQQREIVLKMHEDFGVRPFSTGALTEEGEQLYYASMHVKVGERTATFPFTESAGRTKADVREALRETIKPLIPGLLPTLGVAAPPAEAPRMNPMMQRQQPRQPFAFLQRRLEDDFEITQVDLTQESPRIPQEVQTLLVLRPEELSEQALYAVDQFVMRGGRLILALDSFRLDTQQVRFGNLQVKEVANSGLREMLATWGVKVVPEMLLDERADVIYLNERITRAGISFEVPTAYTYPFFLNLEGGLSEDHPVTSSISSAALLWASPVLVEEVPEGVSATVLARSSEAASTRKEPAAAGEILEGIRRQPYEAPEEAHARPVVLALQGRFPSHFAGRPIPGLDVPAGDGEGETDMAEVFKTPRTTSVETGVVVIGDSDFVSAEVFSALQLEPRRYDENVRLLKNCLDWGGPASELLSIRNRAAFWRPLTELAGKSPEERQATGSVAAWLTTILSVLAVLALGMGFYGYRRSRKPVPLVPRDEVGGALR